MRTIATIFVLFLILTASAHAAVGDFVILEEINSLGRPAERKWPKAAGTLWGTNGGSLPQNVTVGSGLNYNPATRVISATNSGGTWGSITGTLGDQTDLAAALALKAPLASPTFTGTVTIPSGASISGYLTTASAASTYLTITNAASTYLTPTGNGSGLTALNASALSSGTVSDSRLSANVSLLGSSIALGSEVSGTLPIANGGTGQTTASAARVALLPSLTGNANKVLTVNSGASDVEWRTPSSSSTISTPKVIYVEANGNDGTAEIGNPAKPYANGTTAFNAGQATAQPFVMRFGMGEFTVASSAGSGYCRAVFGSGVMVDGTEECTLLTWEAYGSGSTNATGGNAGTVDLQAYHIHLYVIAVGGSVSVDDGNTYTSGNGGTVTVRGHAAVSVDVRGGGIGNLESGAVNGGNGGSITLAGAILIGSEGLRGEGGVGSGSNGSDGTLAADGVDLRGATTSGFSSITLGRCSYTTGLSITDKGGNAEY